MHLLYRLIATTPIAAAITFSLFLSVQLQAQNHVQGVVRIKVTEELAAKLESTSTVRRTSGEVITGVPTLDVINKKFGVNRLTRVFPPAGRHEARHRKHGLHLWYELRMNKEVSLSSVLRSYQSEKQILRAEAVLEKAIINSVDPVIRKENIPGAALPDGANDPMLTEQWHFNNTGQTGGKNGADIRLFEAWKTETGRPEVIIAVTDGGIETDHPDLAANMWVNKGEIAANDLDDDHNGYVDDVHGYSFVTGSGSIPAHQHGTHVAGTIAAVNNNSVGVSGVAGGSGSGDGARLMSCAVFDREGGSDGFAQAYVYSADNGAVISQNSWGYTSPGVFEQVVLDAIDYFIEEAGRNEVGQQTGPMYGGIVIFSAGNANDEGHYYPAYYEPVLAVAATNHHDVRASYSNYGPWIDISAPGGETGNAKAEGVVSTLPGGKYGALMGTSMACPHVSGAAALVVSKFGRQGFSPRALRARLVFSADDIDSLNPSFAGKLGSGRLNAASAVRQGDQMPPEPIADLSVTGTDVGEISLAWTSPRDPGDFAVEYDLRYSTTPITPENFEKATRVTDVPAPSRAGTKETFTVTGLPGNTVFYFAIRSWDFEGNVSALSNVISQRSAPAPQLVITPSQISINLQTAQRSTRTFVVANQGEAVLKFAIEQPEGDTFVTLEPLQGELSPSEQQVVTATFDASRKLSGTYHHHVILTSNDPQRNTATLSFTMKVTNNGAPIASVEPDTVDFRSVQKGTVTHRTVNVYNAGSEPLFIRNSKSDNPAFACDLTAPITLQAFQTAALRITFAPRTTGLTSGKIYLSTNDPANNPLVIRAKGEGLQVAPVTVSPNMFNETLEKGSTVSRTLVLRNNGSQDRSYRLQSVNSSVRNRDAAPASAASGAVGRQKNIPGDSSMATTSHRLREHHRRFALVNGAETVASPLGSGRSAERSAGARTATPEKSFASASGVRRYATGFETFTAGPVGEQEGWFATDGWSIDDRNPDTGIKHLRGTSTASGTGETFAMSPYLFEYEEAYYPQYTSVNMRVNLDNAGESSWEIVPQDPWSYIATRVRFNPDRTIDALVIDNDYAAHWRRVPVTTPSGYFDVAVEYNNAGTDTSGFPTYFLFINNQHVFSGTGLASGIGQVAFASQMESPGIFDVDEVHVTGGEYIPQFVYPEPAEGIIQGGESAIIEVTFDATIMKVGTYDSELLILLDEIDTLSIPVTMNVIGSSEQGILREEWTEISGSEVRDIPLDTPPTATQLLTIFEAPSNTGDNYGARMRGYVQAPVTGAYRFWIASDDQSELWLSTDDTEENKKRIAYITGFTRPGQWTKYATQVSGVINLIANRKYYIEALHKEGAGADHLAVGWELPDGTMERPIPGFRLIPYKDNLSNSDPVITIESPGEGEVFSAPADIEIRANAADEDGKIVKVEFFNGETKLGSDVTAPYRYRWENISEGSYTLTVRATDDLGATSSSSVNIVVKAEMPCADAGRIVREQWNGIRGNSVSLIPLDKEPSFKEVLALFESPSNIGDNYGTRIRGFLCVPLTGEYTFWIASNDKSELWLSSDSDEKNKRMIAHAPRSTDERQWKKFPAQRSEPQFLEAGKKYYVEALHKEGIGTDHLSVGWQLPDGTFERPIPGTRLLPFGKPGDPPVVRIVSPTSGDTFTSPTTLTISADADDNDGMIRQVSFFNGNEHLGEDLEAPYSFTWTNVPEGTHSLTAVAIDDQGLRTTSEVVTISVEAMCSASGTITREFWTGISGNYVSSIPLNREADGVESLTAFEGPVNIGTNYGARISGYICPPQTGEYIFWISSNDHSELWLSSDSGEENKTKIAFITGATDLRQWDKFRTQKSLPVTLVKGRSYYIEALHKQGIGTDHIAVGWQLPDGTRERPIAGSNLSPAKRSADAVASGSPFQGRDVKVSVYPNPVKGEKLTVQIQSARANGNGEIVIRQLTGLSVYSETIECAEGCNAQIDVEKILTPGVYIIQVSSGGKMFTEKLVVP